jgi:ABC-type glycerol-3-phosphate transport system substrate-binding protein
MASKKHPLTEKTQVILTPGGPAGSFSGPSCYAWGIFKASKHADLCEDLIRWVEDEKRFEEYMQASIGQAGPVYKSRVENPYWKTDPNFDGMLQNVLRGTWPGYPGPITPAAVEVQAQYILCDMAGRIVVGGLSPEAALKEAHKRVEDIYRIRSRG